MEESVGAALRALPTHRERRRMAEEREEKVGGGREEGGEEEEEGVSLWLLILFHQYCEKHRAGPCWNRENNFSSAVKRKAKPFAF